MHTLFLKYSYHHKHTQHAYLAINDSREAEVVKDLSAVAPNGDRAIFPQALIVKAIYLGDLSALMVATDQGDPVRVPDL